MSRTKINFKRLKNIPVTTVDDNGTFYVIENEDGTLSLYNVVKDGTLKFLRGITEEEAARLGKLTNNQISKLEGLDTQSELDRKIENVERMGQASYYPLDEDSTILPVPPTAGDQPMDVAWTKLKQGVTYTQAGGSDIVAIEGHDNEAQWDGVSWVLVDRGELPKAGGVDVLNPKGEDLPKEKAVANYALERKSPRILPDGWEVDVVDRPDIKSLESTEINPGNIPVLDHLGNINHFIKTTSLPGDELEFDVLELPEYSMVIVDRDDKIIFTLPSTGDSTGGTETLVHDIYRPDLKRVVLDRGGNIIEIEETVSNTFGYSFLTYINPTEKPPFDVADPEYSWGINYDKLIQKYDDIMGVANSNPESIVVSKGVYGYSGATALPLYYYRLRSTDTPKVKILLTSGTHAAEKMYIFGLYEIFKDMVEQPYQHPTIQWIRDNCEVVFIPCNCPESIGFPKRVNGARTTPETRPFTAAYSSDGNTVTITYSQDDFPTENTGLVWNEYFQVQPDKRMITVWSTDDELILPRGVYEYTVVNGNTITIPSQTPTAESGSCEIQVWTDPNRNVDNGTGIYQRFQISSSIQLLDDGTPYALYDNKGTKAGSLQEVRNWIDFINNEGFDIVIDGHCPPRNHYVRTYNDNLIVNNNDFLKSIKSFSSIFYNDPYDENVVEYNSLEEPMFRGAVSTPNAFTIEWGSGLVRAADWQVTGAVRWVYTVMVGLLKYSVNIK